MQDEEALRQAKDAFEQLKRQDTIWVGLRLTMGCASVVLLIAVLVILAIIIFNYIDFPDKIIGWAGPALFVDILGLMIIVWKVVLNPNFSTRLAPTVLIGIAFKLIHLLTRPI